MGLPWKRKAKEQLRTIAAVTREWTEGSDRAERLLHQQNEDMDRVREREAVASDKAHTAEMKSIHYKMQLKMAQELLEKERPGHWTEHFINVVDRKVKLAEKRQRRAEDRERALKYTIYQLERQVARLTRQLAAKEHTP